MRHEWLMKMELRKTKCWRQNRENEEDSVYGIEGRNPRMQSVLSQNSWKTGREWTSLHSSLYLFVVVVFFSPKRDQSLQVSLRSFVLLLSHFANAEKRLSKSWLQSNNGKRNYRETTERHTHTSSNRMNGHEGSVRLNDNDWDKLTISSTSFRVCILRLYGFHTHSWIGSSDDSVFIPVLSVISRSC